MRKQRGKHMRFLFFIFKIKRCQRNCLMMKNKYNIRRNNNSFNKEMIINKKQFISYHMTQLFFDVFFSLAMRMKISKSQITSKKMVNFIIWSMVNGKIQMSFMISKKK